MSEKIFKESRVEEPSGEALDKVIPPPLSEDKIFNGLSETEKSAWRAIRSKGKISGKLVFKKEWTKDVRSLKGNYPPEIKKILDKEGMTPKENKILQKYFSGFMGWREGIKNRLTDKHNEAPLDEPIQTTESPESYPSKGGIVSQKELIDLKMNIHKLGWYQYWRTHLLSQLDILPPEVAAAISKAKEERELEPSELSAVAKYVSRRILVLRFDISKRQRMEALKNQLHLVGVGEYPYSESELKSRKVINWDEDGRRLVVADDQGKKIYVTLGDVIADYAWGIKYVVSDAMPKTIRRSLFKHIAVNEARRDIESIADQEMGALYGISMGTGAIAVSFFEKQFFRKGLGVGIVAERSVRELLTRISLDNPDLNFSIERSNAFEDSELKYDFKIRIKKHLRGVAIEGEDMPRDEYAEEKRRLGIQFTISSSPGLLAHKATQLEIAKQKMMGASPFVKKRVDDIVLVSVNMHEIVDAFGRWLEEGKPPRRTGKIFVAGA